MDVPFTETSRHFIGNFDLLSSIDGLSEFPVRTWISQSAQAYPTENQNEMHGVPDFG